MSILKQTTACSCINDYFGHYDHCCLREGWNPAAGSLADGHPDLIICEHAGEWRDRFLLERHGTRGDS